MQHDRLNGRLSRAGIVGCWREDVMGDGRMVVDDYFGFNHAYESVSKKIEFSDSHSSGLLTLFSIASADLLRTVRDTYIQIDMSAGRSAVSLTHCWTTSKRRRVKM